MFCREISTCFVFRFGLFVLATVYHIFFLLDMKEEISAKMVDPFLDLTKISDSSLHEV